MNENAKKMKEALEPLRRELLEKIETAESELKPLHEEYDALEQEIAPLEARRRELGEKIHAAEGKHDLRQNRQQLAAIARATGSRTLTNEPA